MPVSEYTWPVRASHEPSEVWILSVRLTTLSVVLLALSYCSLTFSSSAVFHAAYLPLGICFGITGLSALWIQRHKVGAIFSCAQLVIDTVIITGVIYLSGGPVSPFLFLYLPLVMAASIFVSRKGALVTAGIASCFYGALSYFMVEGYLPIADGSELVSIPPGGLLLQWIGISSAMILVSVGTSFLRKSLSSSVQMAQESQESLAEIIQQRQALIESMPDGVIMTNLSGTISTINPAAVRILSLSADEVVGKSIDTLKKMLELNCEFAKPGNGSSESAEFSLLHGQEEQKVKFHMQKVLAGDKTPIGAMYIFQDVTHLRTIEEQLAMQERMARLLQQERESDEGLPISFQGFVGESPVMKKLFQLIARVAPSDATVLITGESGTGKELVAKAIHSSGHRSGRPFIPVNCGAIPETLIESELFGHRKGSFTGAIADHVGLFRQAHGGTIFLDEIGELPLQTQAKLLRAIQEKCVRPVGGETTIPVDVRIIAATNKNLKEHAQNGTFREDLFYRLNVITLSLPPLRDRKDDIPLLINSILDRLTSTETLPMVTPQAMHLLTTYSYPGNVRELENILERAVVLGGEAILPEHLPEVIHENGRHPQHLHRKETDI
ncbi:MAG: sigma 54-interacting transcriptional regulator, partial [Bdellovibrionales bacterium]|nr:sigma 54-interacting transcriptional regulator [Bdellovibrionales bacterium]